MKKLICKWFGHKWRYNFPSLPSKAICVRCKRRERLIFPNLLGQRWVEGFDDKRTDQELIDKWI